MNGSLQTPMGLGVGSYNFVFTCAGVSGTTPASTNVTLNVIAQAAQPTVSVVVSPSSIVQGNTALVTWSSTAATSCSVMHGQR